MSEQWAWVPSLEFEYEVSTLGRVRSHRKATPRVMKQTLDTKGYFMVNLAGRLHRVHRLVARAFIGRSDSLVRHMDGNPTNNELTNLSYGTASENNFDTVRHGRHHKAIVTECPSGHAYTDENTYRFRGHRQCRPCNAIAVAKYKRSKRKVTS